MRSVVIISQQRIEGTFKKFAVVIESTRTQVVSLENCLSRKCPKWWKSWFFETNFIANQSTTTKIKSGKIFQDTTFSFLCKIRSEDKKVDNYRKNVNTRRKSFYHKNSRVGSFEQNFRILFLNNSLRSLIKVVSATSKTAENLRGVEFRRKFNLVDVFFK